MSGFQHAPVTKGLMLLLGVTSLTVSLLDIKPYFHLILNPHMTQYHQFWRILVHPVAFANSTELLMGELLLYNVGVAIERSFGPRKYSSFILMCSALSTLIALTSIVLLHRLGLNYVPAGPYGILFSLLWQHYRTVPPLYTFNIAGFDLSSKIYVSLLALQLLISDSPSSILAASSGLLTGYLYRTDTLLLVPYFSRRRRLSPIKSFRIPLSLYLLLARVFTPLVGTSAPPRRSERVLPGQISGSAPSAGRTTATSLGINADGRPTLRGLLAGRLGGGAGLAPPRPVGGGSQATPSPPAAPTGARAAMGEWVNEMTGSGQGAARAPTEEEITTLSNMFPNSSREAIVRVLQRNDHNTAMAVEALLAESS